MKMNKLFFILAILWQFQSVLNAKANGPTTATAANPKAKVPFIILPKSVPIAFNPSANDVKKPPGPCALFAPLVLSFTLNTT